MPFALLASLGLLTGCGSDESTSTAESGKSGDLKEKAIEIEHKAEEKLGELKKKAGEEATEIKEKAAELEKKAEGKLGELKKKAGEEATEIKEKAIELEKKAGEKLGEIKDKAATTIQDATKKKD
jgi:hypothetical protein